MAKHQLWSIHRAITTTARKNTIQCFFFPSPLEGEGEPTPASPSCPGLSRSLRPPSFVRRLGSKVEASGGFRSSDETNAMYGGDATVSGGTSGLIATQLAWHQGRYMSRQALLEAIVAVAEQEGRPREPSGCRSNAPWCTPSTCSGKKYPRSTFVFYSSDNHTLLPAVWYRWKEQGILECQILISWCDC